MRNGKRWAVLVLALLCAVMPSAFSLAQEGEGGPNGENADVL